ncbi:MAG TPA: tRNA (adenosine(37)-N6)-threonylcarbamoyltransferase complex dimerization subunit type 1 TsaB [Rhodospirillaceae bacterium]|nr:tRNA (adenosine(37)-N6)-threonylcarbamoyltransferase complex dimerization subunit type 1 TsaB [Rhodospirillaceae bacterium]
MRILSIDCASASCAVVAWEDGQVRTQLIETMERGQDARLMPLVLAVMDQSSWGFDDLDRLAVTRGPGSFTGIRIGLATARGTGFTASKPVLGIDRFAIHHAQQNNSPKNLLVVLESRRQELYVRAYPAGLDPAEATMLLPDEITAMLAQDPAMMIAGDGAASAGVDASRVLPATEPEAVTAAMLAAQVEADDPAFLPRPYYLRAPDVTIKKGCA